jgi:hypothetical protein
MVFDCPLSDNAGFLEAEIPLPVIHGLTDDHMVQELDLKNPGSFANPAGQPHIGFTWRRIPRGMIVLCGQNDYVIRRAYRRARPLIGLPRIDQTLHIILSAFLCAPSVM